MPIVRGEFVSTVALPDVGFATATYTDPTGLVWPLTNTLSGWFTVADGVSGIGAAPVELATDDHARGGSRVRHVQPMSRVIVWPLHVYGETHTEFTSRWRQLATAFTRTLREGAGWLEIARPDGSRRRIAVHYQSGYEGQGSQGTGIVSDTAVLSLYCEDPYWRDVTAVTERREYSGAGEDFFQPYPSLTSSQTLGDTELTNPGDVVAWPEWLITGPASSITAENARTGEQFALDPNAAPIGHGNLLTGQQVTITTDPPRVRYQNGDNWVGGLDWPGAVLWGLLPGVNDVIFTLNGSGSGSSVQLSYYPRYETA